MQARLPRPAEERLPAEISRTMIDKDWAKARKILCIRLDAMGDVLMTTPAIRAIQETLQGCAITLLTSSAGAKVGALIPEIDEVIPYESPWMKASRPRKNSSLEYELASYLRQKGFDAAVIFTVYSQNPLPAAFLAYLAGIPLRLAHCRENPYQMLSHWIPETEPQSGIRHEVRRQLDLVETVGCWTKDERLSLNVPAEAERSLAEILDKINVFPHGSWVALHPGATAPSRRFRPDGFAEVARTLLLEFGIQTIFTGVRRENQLVESIQRMMGVPSHNLVGKLNLAEFAALLKIAPLLISNNSGPVHIAAAVGTPVVDLYALTNPQHTPWNVPNRVLNHDVPCKFCYKSVCPEMHHHCLSLVSTDAVIQAVQDLLGMSKSTSTAFNPRLSWLS